MKPRSPSRSMPVLLVLLLGGVAFFPACETGRNMSAREHWPTLTAATWTEMTTPQLHALLEENQINAVDPANGETALMTAARHSPDPVLIRTLIDAGADLDHRNRDGETALMLAVKHNESFEIIQAFLNTRRFCQRL